MKLEIFPFFPKMKTVGVCVYVRIYVCAYIHIYTVLFHQSSALTDTLSFFFYQINLYEQSTLSVYILGYSPEGAATVCVKQLMCKINPNMYVTVFLQDYLQQCVWEKFGMAIMLDHNSKMFFIVTLW